MADFCKQCSEQLGAPLGYSDFPDDVVLDLCEGCGTYVKLENGVCVDESCLLHGDKVQS